MVQAVASPHPNPGRAPSTGQHCILEPDHCDRARLDDDAFLRDTITAAAQRAGATLLHLITHRFQPQGMTHLAEA